MSINWWLTSFIGVKSLNLGCIYYNEFSNKSYSVVDNWGLSGLWDVIRLSIHGKFACPICVEHTKAFILHYLGKFSWFDCHRRLLDLAQPLKHNKQTISNKYNKKEGPCHAPISLDTRILISLLIFIRNKSSCHFSLFFQHCLIWIKWKICKKWIS